jgi:hypothetical protein
MLAGDGLRAAALANDLFFPMEFSYEVVQGRSHAKCNWLSRARLQLSASWV